MVNATAPGVMLRVCEKIDSGGILSALAEEKPRNPNLAAVSGASVSIFFTNSERSEASRTTRPFAALGVTSWCVRRDVPKGPLLTVAARNSPFRCTQGAIVPGLAERGLYDFASA